MEKVPMTAKGHEAMETELKQLKSVDRPETIRMISEAREHGDLSENAEYHAAKERQAFIETRVIQLEDLISRSQVIDPATLSGDTVKFGATVLLVDEDTEEESKYQIVGDHEADVKEGRIAISSPIARALISKEAGDSVDVNTPGGGRSYEILQVQYI
jgi:transcription elongation factor GreA